jgi:hypothetical protein
MKTSRSRRPGSRRSRPLRGGAAGRGARSRHGSRAHQQRSRSGAAASSSAAPRKAYSYKKIAALGLGGLAVAGAGFTAYKLNQAVGVILRPYKEVKAKVELSDKEGKLHREVLRLKRQMNALHPDLDLDETPIKPDQFDAKATNYARQVAMSKFSGSHVENETRPIPENCVDLFEANEELYIEYNKLKAEVDKLEKSVGTPCTRTTKAQDVSYNASTQIITEKIKIVNEKLGVFQQETRSTAYRVLSASASAAKNEECDAFKDNRYRMNLIVDASHNVARSEQLVNYAPYFMTQ